jgi:glycosyltransferase involved in cell wall biosynthesis
VTPLVTLVTPSHNQARFLEETIVSVLEQDYPAIEYFVIDDGSTDDSVAIIERYADRLTWWTRQENAGQVATLNRGFARAGGAYLGWINSDDTLRPHAVSRVVEALEASPRALLAYGGVDYTDAASRVLEYRPPVVLPVEGMVRSWTHVVTQQGSLFRREAYERFGPLDESRYYVFDAEFFLRLALAGELVAIDEPLATYRFHDESHSVSGPARRARDYARLVEDVFAWPDLPAELRALEGEAKAQAYLWIARLFYTGHEHQEARRYYLRALRLAPRLAGRRAGLLLRALLPSRVRGRAA